MIEFFVFGETSFYVGGQSQYKLLIPQITIEYHLSGPAIDRDGSLKACQNSEEIPGQWCIVKP